MTLDIDIASVGKGHYDGALDDVALRVWAREHPVEFSNRPNPAIFGARIVTAELDGCGGTGATKIEALHLLYYVWRDPANRRDLEDSADHERGAT